VHDCLVLTCHPAPVGPLARKGPRSRRRAVRPDRPLVPVDLNAGNFPGVFRPWHFNRARVACQGQGKRGAA